MKKFLLPAVMVLAASERSGARCRSRAKWSPRRLWFAAPSPFDVAVGAGIATDYNFRGISQSNNKASVNAYFEGRYNSSANLQWYAGIGGYSIDFPNRAAAEIDFYAGVRPTFDKLALDFGVWYYYYPGGQCFFSGAPLLPGDPSCNSGAAERQLLPGRMRASSNSTARPPTTSPTRSMSASAPITPTTG